MKHGFPDDVLFPQVELAKCRGKANIPNSWGADAQGQPSTDPLVVLAPGGGLLPLGGVEECGSYKGTGLSMMAELFCGMLAGASFGKNVRQWREVQKPANLVRAKFTLCFI